MKDPPGEKDDNEMISGDGKMHWTGYRIVAQTSTVRVVTFLIISSVPEIHNVHHCMGTNNEMWVIDDPKRDKNRENDKIPE